MASSRPEPEQASPRLTSSPRSGPASALTPAPATATPRMPTGVEGLRHLQRSAGNRAVSQLVGSSDRARPSAPASLQRKGTPPPSQAANLARLNTLRANADARVTLASTYAQSSLAVGDLTRDKLSAISAVYTEAFNAFRTVLNSAQQEAQNQQRYTDIVVGVVCGVAAGLAAAFVLPSTAAGWVSLTLAEAGTAAASSAGQGIASAVVSAAASKALTVPGQAISTAGLEPSIQQLAMWQKVADIYRSGLEVTGLGQASHQATMSLADLIADVRVWEAGGASTLTEEKVAAQLTQLEAQDQQLTEATTQLTAKVAELEALRTATSAINPQAKSALAMERDIWSLWMATLAHDSNILDIDAIENHIGPKGLRIVDFGWYTSDADENAAIDQAKDTAMFLKAESDNATVPRGQVVGGPHQ